MASFLDVATDAFAKCAPDVATSAGTLAMAMFWRAVHQGEEPPPTAHVALQVPAVHGDLVLVDELFVEAAHEHGLAVHVWTINDENEMARLLDLGVDGIISDLPTALVSLVGRGAWLTAPEGLPVRALEPRSSAPTGVGPLAVVGLLLAPDLALDGPLRHGDPRYRVDDDAPPPCLGRPLRPVAA